MLLGTLLLGIITVALFAITMATLEKAHGTRRTAAVVLLGTAFVVSMLTFTAYGSSYFYPNGTGSPQPTTLQDEADARITWQGDCKYIVYWTGWSRQVMHAPDCPNPIHRRR